MHQPTFEAPRELIVPQGSGPGFETVYCGDAAMAEQVALALTERGRKLIVSSRHGWTELLILNEPSAQEPIYETVHCADTEMMGRLAAALIELGSKVAITIKNGRLALLVDNSRQSPPTSFGVLRFYGPGSDDYSHPAFSLSLEEVRKIPISFTTEGGPSRGTDKGDYMRFYSAIRGGSAWDHFMHLPYRADDDYSCFAVTHEELERALFLASASPEELAQDVERVKRMLRSFAQQNGSVLVASVDLTHIPDLPSH